MDNPNTEHINYNDIPVFYCKNCMSLKIKTVAIDSDLDYCDECGSTNIGQMHIDEWNKIYEKNHGFKFIDKDIVYGRK